MKTDASFTVVSCSAGLINFFLLIPWNLGVFCEDNNFAAFKQKQKKRMQTANNSLFFIIAALTVLSVALLAGASHGAAPPSLACSFMSACSDMLQVRVCVMDAASVNGTTKPRADILYLHGYADRADNHVPLFRNWSDAGFRGTVWSN